MHAAGSIEVERLIGANGKNAFANCYVANGLVVAPMTGAEADERGVEQLAKLFPDREVVARAGCHDRLRGRRAHCITQQVPV